jgi:hypothetical protein
LRPNQECVDMAKLRGTRNNVKNFLQKNSNAAL